MMRVPLITIVAMTDGERSAQELLDEARDVNDTVSHLYRVRADGEDHFVAELRPFRHEVAKFINLAALGISGSSKMWFELDEADLEAGDRHGYALVQGMLSFQRRYDTRSSDLTFAFRHLSVVWSDDRRSLALRDGYHASTDGVLGVHPSLLRFSLSKSVRGVIYFRETLFSHRGALVDVSRFVFVKCTRSPGADTSDDVPQDVFTLTASVYERPVGGFRAGEKMFDGWRTLARDAVCQYERFYAPKDQIESRLSA